MICTIPGKAIDFVGSAAQELSAFTFGALNQAELCVHPTLTMSKAFF